MSVPAAVAAGTESGGEPQNDLLKYVLIAGGATAVAVAIAYVLFGGGEKDKKKKKKATEPKVTPSKAQPTETKVVMEDLPEDDDEVRLKTSAVRKLKPAATNVSYCVCL